MKCPNCGGEVDSIAEKCPYCQTVMPSGVAYQAELEKRMQKMKLLKPFMLNKIAPQAVSKVMNNILLVMVLTCLVLFFLTLLVSTYIYYEPEGKKPMEGSYAANFMDRDYSQYVEYRTSVIKELEKENSYDDFYVEYSISSAFEAYEGHEDEIEAYLKGYLCFDEELWNEFLEYCHGKEWEYDTEEKFAKQIYPLLEAAGYSSKE